MLLPSQTRSGNIDERKRGAKTAPAPTTSRHTSRQPEPPGKHFHPPQTKPPSRLQQYAPLSPSRDKTTLPIPTKRSNFDHNSHLRRAIRSLEGATAPGGRKRHPKQARPVRELDAPTRRAGESLIRVGAVGIRIRETPLRFPNSWAGGKTNPPRGTSLYDFGLCYRHGNRRNR